VIERSTAFPVTIMRAATWDLALEERVGLAMGREARARGANYSGAVCVNLLRHPAWGRAQECYGEDPVLTGQMGAGLTRGLRRNVMAWHNRQKRLPRRHRARAGGVMQRPPQRRAL
jgi:beta-glucosidase